MGRHETLKAQYDLEGSRLMRASDLGHFSWKTRQPILPISHLHMIMPSTVATELMKVELPLLSDISEQDLDDIG
jgi:hypothetical protein